MSFGFITEHTSSRRVSSISRVKPLADTSVSTFSVTLCSEVRGPGKGGKGERSFTSREIESGRVVPDIIKGWI